MGRAMFTIIGAMAELESSLISERVSTATTSLSIRAIHTAINQQIGRGRVGEITQQIHAPAKAKNAS